ncbi:hypothetical protein IFM89_039562, partial [Coptis chinensis]
VEPLRRVEKKNNRDGQVREVGEGWRSIGGPEEDAAGNGRRGCSPNCSSRDCPPSDALSESLSGPIALRRARRQQEREAPSLPGLRVPRHGSQEIHRFSPQRIQSLPFGPHTHPELPLPIVQRGGPLPLTACFTEISNPKIFWLTRTRAYSRLPILALEEPSPFLSRATHTRAPEVLLGYSTGVDMWSVGCIFVVAVVNIGRAKKSPYAVRDLKPSNLLLNGNCDPKRCDLRVGRMRVHSDGINGAESVISRERACAAAGITNGGKEFDYGYYAVEVVRKETTMFVKAVGNVIADDRGGNSLELAFASLCRDSVTYWFCGKEEKKYDIEALAIKRQDGDTEAQTVKEEKCTVGTGDVGIRSGSEEEVVTYRGFIRMSDSGSAGRSIDIDVPKLESNYIRSLSTIVWAVHQRSTGTENVGELVGLVRNESSGAELELYIYGQLPTEADLECMNENAKRYSEQVPGHKRQLFSERFPHAHPAAVDLVEKMLTFDPRQRRCRHLVRF